MVMRMTMMATTTINSTNVKPRSLRLSGRLPLAVASPIGSLFAGFTENIKNVLTAPTGGIGVVLIAAHSPFGFAGERIARNPAQEPHLLILGAARQLHAVHQYVERFRIAVGALFDGSERIAVGVVFVLIDGPAYIVQGEAELAFALGSHFGPRQRDRHARQDEHDREGHNQLDQGHTAPVIWFHAAPSHAPTTGCEPVGSRYRRWPTGFASFS